MMLRNNQRIKRLVRNQRMNRRVSKRSRSREAVAVPANGFGMKSNLASFGVKELLQDWQYCRQKKDPVPPINFEKVNKLRARGLNFRLSREQIDQLGLRFKLKKGSKMQEMLLPDVSHRYGKESHREKFNVSRLINQSCDHLSRKNKSVLSGRRNQASFNLTRRSYHKTTRGLPSGSYNNDTQRRLEKLKKNHLPRLFEDRESTNLLRRSLVDYKVRPNRAFNLMKKSNRERLSYLAKFQKQHQKNKNDLFNRVKNRIKSLGATPIKAKEFTEPKKD